MFRFLLDDVLHGGNVADQNQAEKHQGSTAPPSQRRGFAEGDETYESLERKREVFSFRHFNRSNDRALSSLPLDIFAS